MERVFKKFPKYRQRLTSVGRKWHGARFEDDPVFDTKNHIHTVQLPEPAGKDELETLVSPHLAFFPLSAIAFTRFRWGNSLRNLGISQGRSGR